jgi:nucleotide-binding universal stress UspA family protein
MKTILTPTDYSTTSRNATDYAIELAKLTNSKIILLHALTVPVATMEIHGPLLYNIGDLERENEKIIQTLKNEISRKNPGLIIESLLTVGFPVEEILNTSKEENADLVVMGLKGMSKAEEAIIGSNTSSVVKDAHCPVLVVPDGAVFKAPKNIVIACDYNKDFENESMWIHVREFVKTFNSTVFILDVLNKKESTTVEIATTGLKVEKFLNDIPHTLHFIEGEDLIESINNFVREKNADMLVMLPKRYNAIKRLFHKSNTRKVIFHTDIPVLTLHAE